MISFRAFLASARAQLPGETLARWASASFSLSVLTILISLAASQAFLAVSALLYTAHLLRDRPKIHFPPVRLPLALFCLGTTLSVLWAANPDAGWFSVRKLVLFVILLLGANLIVTAEHLEFLFYGLFFESAIAGVVAMGQFAAQYRSALALHPDRVYATLTSDRITGFMGHWMNFGGQQMLVVVALLAYLLLTSGVRDSGFGVREGGRSWRAWGWLGWLALAVIGASIVLNFTRGVWLGCFVATVYLVARWKPRWLVALPALIVIAYLAAPGLVRHRVEILRHPSQDPALSIRFEMWQVAMQMIRRHPWLGVGPNNIEREYVLYLPPGKSPEPGYHAHFHNNFFQFGAERGLPVLAAWTWFMAALGVHTVMIRRRLNRLRWIADAAFAGWLALLVEGCFEFNFGTSPVLMLFLFLVTTPFIAKRIESAASAKVEAGSRESKVERNTL
ncbi:MAG: O-antigen ligase family protein [Terriglobia bacterium]